MNLNIPGMLLLLGGLILGYAAVSNKDPREVVQQFFTGRAPSTPISRPVVVPVPPSSNQVWV